MIKSKPELISDFSAGSVPVAADFENLIDTALSPFPGTRRPSGRPLEIEAELPTANRRNVLHFYEQFESAALTAGDPNIEHDPKWTLALLDEEDNSTGTPVVRHLGLSISDGTTDHLFIGEDGQIGIGKTAPASALDVEGMVTASGLSLNGVIGISNSPGNAAMQMGLNDAGDFLIQTGEAATTILKLTSAGVLSLGIENGANFIADIQDSISSLTVPDLSDINGQLAALQIVQTSNAFAIGDLLKVVLLSHDGSGGGVLMAMADLPALDSTTLDLATAVGMEPGLLSVAAANLAIDNLNRLDNRVAWRLPTLQELEEMRAKINQHQPGNATDDIYLATQQQTGSLHDGINFGTEESTTIDPEDTTHTARVRLVRDFSNII